MKAFGRWGFTFRQALFIAGSLIVVLSVVGCRKKASYEMVAVIGHGGNGLANYSSIYHDNSLKAIELALATSGCDGVEVDVQLSADGTCWLFHDEELNLATNGEGCVPNQTDGYLSGLKYSFNGATSSRLARLSDIPSNWLEGRTIYLDLRHFNACSGVMVDFNQMLTGINEFNSANSNATIYCLSNDAGWIDQLIQAGYSVLTQIEGISAYESANLTHPQLTGFVARNNTLSPDDVSLIKNDGKRVVLFDMRAPSSIRKAFGKYPDAIMTDNVHNAIIERYP